MPFTPFHMGAVLISKPICNSHLSLITFGLAQIIMDLEPGIGMLTGAKVLHGSTHTILGAIGIAIFVAIISPPICSSFLRKLNKEFKHYQLHWLIQSEQLLKRDVIFSAFFGTLSHVALDSLLHADIRPLAPFSQVNPLFGIVSHDGVYQLCTIAGVVGFFVWIFMMWSRKNAS